MDLPDLGDSSGRVLSAESEREYSEGLLRQLRNYGLSIDDAELVEYYETLANRLVQASGRTETRFHFELIDVPVVNAFASPGGLVVTFSELMLQADNESELAGVLSHEIAHVTQRHIARAMESSIEDVLPILIGAVALAVATRGQGDGGPPSPCPGLRQVSACGGGWRGVPLRVDCPGQHRRAADRPQQGSLSEHDVLQHPLRDVLRRVLPVRPRPAAEQFAEAGQHGRR